MSWALITGATSGIGNQFAHYYAEKGYNLILTGTKDKIKNVADQLNNLYSVNVQCFIGDLSNEQEQTRLVEFIKDKEIEILVNNAGFGYNSFFDEGNITRYIAMIQLHNILAVRLISIILPKMRIKNKGTIINISSESAYAVIPKNAVYAATKAFLKQFSKGLYIDLYNSEIKVVAVCPGHTKTNFHSNMGIDKQRKSDKSIKWDTPELVVKETIKALNKNKCICITGKQAKKHIFLNFIMPFKKYCKAVLKKY